MCSNDISLCGLVCVWSRGSCLGNQRLGLFKRLRAMELGKEQSCEFSHGRADLADDHPDDDESGFSSVANVGQRPQGLLVTLFINWIVKPFSMALLAWIFFRFMFSAWITPAEADQYIAGAIILAAAPCTAMVFVWSYLTDGDPAYTLIQVSVNDLIMLVLFAPIVGLLVSGASSLSVPFAVLAYSVIGFIVIPLVLGVLIRQWFIRQQGKQWFERQASAAVCAHHHCRIARHLSPDFRLSGRQYSRQTPPRPAHRGPDSSASLFQRLSRVRLDEVVAGAVCRGRARSTHRGEQLLRTRCGDGDCVVWSRIRCCAGDRCRGIRGGSRHAVGVPCLQSDPALVPIERGNR